MAINVKKPFNEKVLTEEQLEAGILRNPDGSEADELEVAHGNPRAIQRSLDSAGPSRGQLLETMEIDETVLESDPKVLERESSERCVANPMVLTDAIENRIASAAMIQAALKNPNALSAGHVPQASRHELAQLLQEAAKDIPSPDSISFVDNRRIIIPAEVREVPNALTKSSSMKKLEIIIGPELILKVLKCARSGGVCFFQKPCMWLAQRLAQELSKRMIWEKIEIKESDMGYDEKDDGNNNSEICKAVASLFSYHVLEQMQVICATRRISMLTCVRILVDRVCNIAIQEKLPKDYVDKYDDMNALELAVQKLGTQNI